MSQSPQSSGIPWGVYGYYALEGIGYGLIAVDVVNSIILPGPDVGIAGGILIGTARTGRAVAQAARGGAGPVRAGQAGEAAVGIVGPKVRINIPGSNRVRIPDRLTETTLTEVKNVQSLSYTQQLRDFAAFSQDTGRAFELFVRSNTTLSGPLQQAVSRGEILLRTIPGT